MYNNIGKKCPCGQPYMPNTSWDELFALYSVVSLKDSKKSISIAVGTNYPLNKLEELRFVVGKSIRVIHKDQACIDQELIKQFPHISAKSITGSKTEVKQTFRIIGSDDTPTIDLVNDIINKAIKLNASDIHVEPLEKELRIRYRMVA
jgi:type IV pilus assembly protein PilB